ncbi:MAG TPA: hypothetical protein VMF65_04590 [Acidimicrobiales bacterium]|nr:hypothetical protein [Acidimicrobiales bacterium]
MFSAGSRYYGVATYSFTPPGGQTVAAVCIPAPRASSIVGYYPHLASERLDLVATRFLNAPTGFWQLCDANNSMVPGALAARPLIGIPPSPPPSS